MAFDSKGLDEYVDVAQRIADFRELHPEGTLQPLNLNEPYRIVTVEGTDKAGKQFTATLIVYTAAAYRTPDDTRPGIGTAWEVFPGRTPYTLGSELMNAETSAWGRAIIAALASESKRGVSSREEVRNRRAEQDTASAPPGYGQAPPEVDEHGAATFAEQTRMVTGPVPGTQRLRTVPPDDEFYDPGQPGTATVGRGGQLTALWTVLSKEFGFTAEEKADARAVCERIIGRKLRNETTGDLSFNEARAVLDTLANWRAVAESDGNQSPRDVLIEMLAAMNGCDDGE